MNINELNTFNLADAVKFHHRLNPRLWGSDEHLLPKVREKLLAIAADFQEFLGVDDLTVQDLTISGSNAAYSYTANSDIDLHLVVEMPDDPVYRELFNAKKYQYNDEHDIRIGGVPVELYVQPADQKHVSQGIYSVKNGDWTQVPQRRRARIDDSCVQNKTADLDARIHAAVESGDADAINRLWDRIKDMRKTGLEQNGEFGCENITFKLLRNMGCIGRLKDAKTAIRDRELSLEQAKKPRKRMNYGMRDYWYPGTAYAGQDHPAGTESEQVDEAVSGPRIVVVGDSIAVGIAQAAGLPYEAVVGRSTRQILDAAAANPQVQGADLAIVSAGTNDYAILKGGGKNPNRKATIQNIGRIRDVLKARQYVWILPFYETARDDVLSAIGGDAYVSLADVATTGDRLHPKNYKAVANAALSKFAKPGIMESVDPDHLKKILHRFYRSCVSKLELKDPPRLRLETTPDWSKENGSFGQYESETNTLILATAGRHVLDILRTMAHEMTHRQQDEREPLPADAGETGSPYEDQANAMAGRIMRQWAEEQPEMFDGATLEESISNETAVVTRIDPRRIRDFSAKMNTYRHTDDWSQSGVDTGDDSYWKNKNLKTNTTKGVFAGDPLFTALYATGSSAETRYVAKYGPGQPTVWFDKNDIPKLKNKQSYLTVFDAGNFEKKPSGEYFSSNPGRPIKQERITDPFAYIKKQGWKIQQTDDLPAVLEHLKAQGIQPGTEGMGFAEQTMSEASGYIPTRKQAKDPRFVMALTRDVQPGAVGREANKLGLQTDSQGHPALLTAGLQKLLREFKEQDLFEINMGGKNLRREAAKTGALAGMEFEMIVPNTEGGGDDDEQEPDYDQDERASSPRDIRDFFYDGDFNSRRSVDSLIDSMMEDYGEWQLEEFGTRWDSDSEQFIYHYIKENMDDDDVRGMLGLESEDRVGRNEYQLAADKIAAEQIEPWYEDAKNDASDSFFEDDQFEEWLEDAGLTHMSDIENRYSGDVTWPHYRSVSMDSETSIADIAEDFSQAVGRPARASDSYHAYGQERPAPGKNFYVVEPDGSLEPDDPDDAGLEFVSPPLPIDEIMSDLLKVKKWADQNGCYTNKSTGLHINISVPNYDLARLDFVKLALLMGDEYVLNQFGRASNTYAKSAMGKVRDHVRQRPYEAKYLLDKMKGHMGELASKAIHSGSTDKYTSINTKDGHVEFRSPGGDWLGDNFGQIENTLLRFTVALSAAMDPAAYREEYLKKLYKTLNAGNDKGDLVNMFARYSAGLLPADALKSFVRQVQAERKAKKSGEAIVNGIRWRVSLKPWRGDGVVEVMATDPIDAKKEAIRLMPAWRFIGDNAITIERLDDPAAGTSTTGPHPQGRGRPNDPNGRLAIVRRDDPLVFAYSSGTPSPAPDYLFRFTLPDGYSQAQLRSVLAAWAARENANAADYMIVDTTQFAAPEQTAAPESGSVQWNIINRNNETVHTFWNRNVQRDANTAAHQWLHANYELPSVDMQGPFDVIPAAGSQIAFIPGSTLDLQRQRQAASQAPTPVAGVQDIEPDVEQYTSQPAQTQWEVYDRSTDRPVFRMYAANQAEAWRKGQEWVANYARMTPDQPIYGIDYSVRQSTAPVTEGRENDNLVAQKIFFARSDKAPDGWSYDHVGFITRDGRQIQMSGHKGNDVYVTNTVTDDPEFPEQKIKIVSLSKPVSVPTTNAVGAENCGTFVAKVLQANGIKGITTQKIYSVFKQPHKQDVTESISVLERRLRQDLDALGNQAPTGPESPPKMPAGTIKVDVSDMYDWYKLGQHISNLKGIDKSTLGTGPPHTVFAFGSEELENKYSHELTNLGLKTHDLDEPGEEDVDESREITKLGKLDSVLEKCIDMIRRGYETDPEKYGRVAACLIDNKNNHTYAINMPGPDGTRRHAERMAIDKHLESHGRIGPNAIMITTLSPCVDHMDERYGESCTDLLSDYGIEKCYAGWQDPTQHPAVDYPFNLKITDNADIFNTCKDIAASFLPQAMAESQELDEKVNPKVIEPGFTAEKKLGDRYVMKAQARYTGEPGDDLRGLIIKLYDIKAKGTTMNWGIGQVRFVARQDPETKDWYLVSSTTHVDDKYQRQGLASAMYNWARELGNDIEPSSARTKMGRHFWDKGAGVGREFVPPVKEPAAEPVAEPNRPQSLKDRLFKMFTEEYPMVEAYTGPQMKFLRPGELSGSYSPQQMQAMGFKQSANGAWYIPMNMWQRLVSGGQIRENFADGRNPQDKGDSKRHGVPTKASVSTLRKVAKQGGRKGQLAHWMANMKAGRAKAKRKTNEAVDAQTVANFATRVQFALDKIAQNTDPKYPDHREFVQLIAANKVNIMNGNPSNTAFSSGWDLNMDAEEFHDAPIEVLILVMAHEIGHIIYGHTFRDPKAPPLTVAQEQQEEYAADQFAINIMKRLGIQKVPVWTWLRRKKNDLEQFKQDQDAAPPGSWPTFNQRSDRARKLGVELTKINTDQIDQALQHMA